MTQTKLRQSRNLISFFLFLVTDIIYQWVCIYQGTFQKNQHANIKLIKLMNARSWHMALFEAMVGSFLLIRESKKNSPRHRCRWFPKLTVWLKPSNCKALPRTAFGTNRGEFSNVPWMSPMSAGRLEPEIRSIDKYRAGGGGAGIWSFQY